MKIVESSMKHPVTVTMITAAVVLFGTIALSRLPVNLLPEITYPTLTVRTEYPDAAPAEVEDLVTEPLEEAVAVVRGLRSLRSVSRSGLSEITLEFAWKTDMDYAALDVREKIDLVRLPDDTEPPVLLRFDPALDPILRVGLYGEKDLTTLRYLAERAVKKELEAIDGVAAARVRGGLEEEIQVEIDEARLAAYGIPIASVSRLLDSQNVNAAGGRLRDREAEFLIRTVNEFGAMDDIGNTVLYEDAGRRIALQDVAEIRRGHKDREVIFRVNGREAVEVSIYKEGDANTVQVAGAVQRRLARISEDLPEGARTEVLFDQSRFITQAVNEVRSNAILGGILAILVLYLFLKDRRSTAIIGVTIPLSILATFVVMQQLGVTLNIMSLGGLALGVGMMVDNSIVVLEAINRYRAEGMGAWKATRKGAGEVSRAVVASTLTTVAVFVPIIFVEGMAGQIFRDMALAVTGALVVSLAAALTLIPVMSSAGTRVRKARVADTSGMAGAGTARASVPVDVTGRSQCHPAADAYAAPGHTERGHTERGYTAPGHTAPGHVAPAHTAPAPAERAGRRGARVFRPVGAVFRPIGGALRPIGAVLRRAGRIVASSLRWVGRGITVFVPGLLVRGARYAAIGVSRALAFLFAPVLGGFDRLWRRAEDGYPRVLRWALLHRGRTLGLVGLLAVGALVLVPTLGTELVPTLAQGELTFDLEFPAGTPLLAGERAVRSLEATIEEDPRVRACFANVGESPELGGSRSDRRENVAQLHLALANPGDRVEEEAVIETVRRALNAQPDIAYTFRRPSYFSFKTPIEVHLYGYDLDLLRRYADTLARDMARLPRLRDVETDLELGSPEVQIRFRRDRVASLDMDLETVARTLRHKIRGEVATRLRESDQEVDIRVRTAEATELDVDQVAALAVGQQNGIPIPLATVADVQVERGPSQISHIGQQRAAVVRAGIAGRDLGGATREIADLLRSNPPPAGVVASLGGQNEEVSSSFRGLLLAAALAIFMVYMVMASQFESFLHPFVILFTVPLGLVGVAYALALTGTPVSVVVLIGMVMLSGIVVNNAIILVDFVNRRRAAGMAKLDALVDGAGARLRPILMTTLTTVLALLPMALGLGEGAELRAPMAVAVIGGLMLATALTLVVIPVVYSLVDRKA